MADTKSMSLQSILDAFKGPVNEEQTWAICFQVIKYIQSQQQRQLSKSSSQQSKEVRRQEDVHSYDTQVTTTTASSQQQQSQGSSDDDQSSNQYNDDVHGHHSHYHHLKVYPRLTNPSQIVLHSDGSISLDNIASHDFNEKEFITNVGIVLYDALDYGCDESEERNLEPSLESFIEKLTIGHSNGTNNGSDNGGDDEGIEFDADDTLTLNSVVTMCVNHLFESNTTKSIKNGLKVSTSSSSAAAEKHYKNVTRAIVSEAKDLITFLDQITKGSKQLRNISSDPLINAALDELCVNDWARLWMQLVKDLRNGVRLKKVDTSCKSIKNVSSEYELTPYEMLLDDIRCQRYTLKHVNYESVISNQVKKDAHSLILEFIRSRPPLKPVKERKLPPTPIKVDCQHEQLMKSIKKEHKLRPTNSLIERRPRRQYASLYNIRESFDTFDTTTTSQQQRVLINESSDYPELGVSRLDGVTSSAGVVWNKNRRNSTMSMIDTLPVSPGRRKLIRADIDLDLVCYSDDEDDDSCVVTRRKSVIPTTRSNDNDNKECIKNGTNKPLSESCDRRRSFRNLFGFGQSFRWNFKSNS